MSTTKKKPSSTPSTKPAASWTPVAIPKKQVDVIDLFSSSNAFAILAKCHRAARKAGWSEAEFATFKSKATDGDFDRLLQVTMEHFNDADEELDDVADDDDEDDDEDEE